MGTADVDHDTPSPDLDLHPLWTGPALPSSADIPVLDGVRFSVIKPHEPERDGGNWLLGVALAWHRGRLHASYGFNTNADENTATEQAHCRISDDAGRTWGPATVLAEGADNLAVSHGVFCARDDELWAFHGAFHDNFQRTHTRAYRLDQTADTWRPMGVVVDEGFWPLQRPQRMADGNWIMSGVRVTKGYPHLQGHLPAVAISHGDDLSRWDLKVIPAAPGIDRVWGESAVIVNGSDVLNIARRVGADGPLVALAATSNDHGRTWTPARTSNLPMVHSKPEAGLLSTGQPYLIGTVAADVGRRGEGTNQRSPLTIAVGRPGERSFCRLFTIRDSVFPAGPGPSDPLVDLSYPYAIERDGHLYVGYAIKRHRTAEMAVIPIAVLAV